MTPSVAARGRGGLPGWRLLCLWASRAACRAQARAVTAPARGAERPAEARHSHCRMGMPAAPDVALVSVTRQRNPGPRPRPHSPVSRVARVPVRVAFSSDVPKVSAAWRPLSPRGRPPRRGPRPRAALPSAPAWDVVQP
eukprot:6896750-Prymnesium_polylepis.1